MTPFFSFWQYIDNILVTADGGPAFGGELGGGSGCPAVWQLMNTLEKGWIRADEILIGMHLVGVNADWVKVLAVNIKPAPIWKCVIDNEEFYVNDTHAWLTEGNIWRKANEIQPGEKILNKENSFNILQSSEFYKNDYYVGLTVEGNIYTMSSKNLIAHNIIYKTL